MDTVVLAMTSTGIWQLCYGYGNDPSFTLREAPEYILNVYKLGGLKFL